MQTIYIKMGEDSDHSVNSNNSILNFLSKEMGQVGITKAWIAREVGLHERSVYRHLSNQNDYFNGAIHKTILRALSAAYSMKKSAAQEVVKECDEKLKRLDSCA